MGIKLRLSGFLRGTKEGTGGFLRLSETSLEEEEEEDGNHGTDSAVRFASPNEMMRSPTRTMCFGWEISESRAAEILSII